MVAGLHAVKAIQFRTGNEIVQSLVCSIKEQSCMERQCDVCFGRNIIFNEKIEDVNVKYSQWITQK